ncbi:sensor histidine kinase [Nocardiopsis halophila]|uniref:sensor histidine kinase n=1 Tax=Nocardiopsis halophila TaxID=141692 RepID=UPI00034C04F9|nr:sensor histidine kinase [Nocardiopsis halophila]
MSAIERAGLHDAARWASLSGGRAPLVLHLAFWGAYSGLLLLVAVTLVSGSGAPPPPDTPLGQALELLFVLGLVPAGVLWPLLSWTPGAHGIRPKALSLSFFACAAAVILGSGNLLVQILLIIALGNVVVVLGARAALACSAGLTACALGLFAVQPGMLARGVLETSVILFLCAVTVMAFNALLAAQTRARETQEVLAELESAHSELRRYADRVKELTVAEERARMARDMHDSIGHYLTVLNIGLSNAERFRTAKPDAAWQEVADAKRLAQEALADTRRWVRALRPLQLEGKAGPEAVRSLAEAFSGGGSAGADVRFTCRGDWPELREEVELVCYRVVQEGLTNAVRHSGARGIEVAVECTPDGVTASVVDDGRGPGAAAPSGAGGFGIAGLRERVEAVGGTLEAGPRGGAGDPDGNGGGFTLRARLPARRTAEVAA